MTTTALTPVALSPEQRAAADHLLGRTRVKPVQTLGGYAGTGKTTVIRHLSAALPGWLVVAFTGKAADVLRRKGLAANTIHSTIYRPVRTAKGVRFELKPAEAVGAAGFLVDEASMVGRDVFRDLRSYDLPVIAVGDHGQLPPVGEDAGLMMSPDVRLETVHRNAGPIARFAEQLRLGRPAGTPPQRTGTVVYVQRAAADAALVTADQIICGTNATRVGLNRTVRRLLGRPDGDAPVVGDRVMCLRNDRLIGVFNGQQGTVAELDAAAGEMLFAPTYGEPVWVDYHPAAWNAAKPPAYDRDTRPGEDIPFDFAYAVTAHKSQGDEWGKVIVYEERCRLWEHSRWAYTAASRAKEKLLWVTA